MGPEVPILYPNSIIKPVPNPLYTYHLNGLNEVFKNSKSPDVPVWFNDWTQTYRWPNNAPPPSHNPTEDQVGVMKEYVSSVLFEFMINAATSAFANSATIKILDDSGTVQDYYIPSWHQISQMVHNLFTLPMAQEIPSAYYGNMCASFHDCM